MSEPLSLSRTRQARKCIGLATLRLHGGHPGIEVNVMPGAYLFFKRLLSGIVDVGREERERATRADRVSVVEKLRVLITHVQNWPIVVVDRLGLASTVTYKLRTGAVFRCRSQTTDGGEVVVVASGREYEREFVRLSTGEPVVIDLGANVGGFIVFVDFANKGVDYSGYAFEPFASNFEMLEINRNLNGITRFALEQMAVTGVDGEVLLDTDQKADRIRVSGAGTDVVRSTRLDTYCRNNGIARVELLKIDVEGAEYEIVESAWDFIASAVDRIVLEYHVDGNVARTLALEDRLATVFDVRRAKEQVETGLMYCRRRIERANTCSTHPTE